MANNNNNTVPAIKQGDWVLPILVDGVTVYALQINKSKEDKENIESIQAEYKKAGVPVYEYAGKNNNPVLLVEASKKLKASRTSVKRDNFIATAMASFGVSREKAEQAYAEMQANEAAKKSNK